MSEEIVQSCSNCEWLVTVGNDKACNALSIVSDDVTDDLCGQWELRDVIALQERNKATAQQVTHPVPVNMRESLISQAYRPSLNSFNEMYYVTHPPIRVGEEMSPQGSVKAISQRQQSLNKVHQLIYKIEI